MPDFSIENEYKNKGCKIVCGIDEAGRGPLAGPVCAAAVILPDGCFIEGLDDSKKLSEKKREELYDTIIKNAVSYAVSYGTLKDIEEFNILQATFTAMKKSVEKLKVIPDFALIDGNRTPKNFSVPCAAVIKGDSLSCSIAAASVLAKVTRDRLMRIYDGIYPEYNFKKHKGYGTKEHYEAIKRYGISPIHRLTFLKNVL